MKTRHKLALAQLASGGLRFARRAIGGNDMAEVTRGGLRWRLDLREGIDLAIYLFGRFEGSTLKGYASLVKPGDMVFDVGANIGAHTLPLACLVGGAGRVVAFEPTRYAFDKLIANVGLNPELATRIVCEQIMLAECDEKPPAAAIASSWPLGAGVHGHPLHGGVPQSTAGASSCRLDTYVASRSITHVELIKLDVDGHECRVLAGAADILRRFRPIIVLEIAPYVLREHGSSVDELTSLLAAAGYRLFSESSARPLASASQLETMIPEGASLNAIARPV